MNKIEQYLATKKRDLTDQVIVITGANSGIGFESARILASWGAHIVLACRNQAKAQTAIDEILLASPHAKLTYLAYDQASFVSIRNFVSNLKKQFPRLDGIVFNAGLYHPAKGLKTKEGFPLTVGTNYLGMVYLLDQLLANKALDPEHETRLIFVGSLVWASSEPRFKVSDMLNERKNRNHQYVLSKVLIVRFVVHLQNKRSWREYQLSPKWSLLLTHPGVSGTNIVNTNSKGFSKSFKRAADGVMKVFLHSPLKASLGIVEWFSQEEIRFPNLIYVPQGLGEISGFPKLKKRPKSLFHGGAICHQATAEIIQEYENNNK